jgi:hypothetical protein
MIGVWQESKRDLQHCRAAPPQATMAQWSIILKAAESNKQLAILKVSGNEIKLKHHDAFLHLLASWLPRLGVIALNIGEMNGATPTAYDTLAMALGHPACIVAHLYWNDPVNIEEVERKERVKDILTINRFKLGYCQQLLRHEVFHLHGANCWVNFEPRHQARAGERIRKESEAVSQSDRDDLASKDVVYGHKAILKSVLKKLVNKLVNMETKRLVFDVGVAEENGNDTKQGAASLATKRLKV